MVRKRNGMTLSIIGLSSLYAMRDLYYNIEIPRRAAHIKLQERENTNILDFGEAIPYKRKIEIIMAEFRKYADEQKPETADV